MEEDSLMKMYLPFGDWSGDGHKPWDMGVINI